MGDLPERVHELANGLAAIQLWLVQLQRQPTCAQCASRQAEALASLRQLVEQAIKQCLEVHDAAGEARLTAR